MIRSPRVELLEMELETAKRNIQDMNVRLDMMSAKFDALHTMNQVLHEMLREERKRGVKCENCLHWDSSIRNLGDGKCKHPTIDHPKAVFTTDKTYSCSLWELRT